MKHETLNAFQSRVYAICEALTTADNREDVSAAMSAFYGLLDDVYVQGVADTLTTAAQTATA